MITNIRDSGGNSAVCINFDIDMEQMIVNFLGCGSATPTPRHTPAAQIIDYKGELYMIDCGEGAQLQMSRMGLSFHRLQHIFLSHLHGDHVLGLIPLLSTMALNDKGGQVVIHTLPQGIEVFKQMFNFFVGEPSYTIKFAPVNPRKREVVLKTSNLTVESVPLKHSIPAVGYLFRENPKERHLIKSKLETFNVPLAERPAIKAGADLTLPDGRIIPNSQLTTDPSPSVSYAYCSDTAYFPELADEVKGVDLLYHESTYASDRKANAPMRGHSTAEDAATTALNAGVGGLVLGHYSKTADENRILAEAKAIFPNSILSYEGMRLPVKAKDNG